MLLCYVCCDKVNIEYLNVEYFIVFFGQHLSVASTFAAGCTRPRMVAPTVRLEKKWFKISTVIFYHLKGAKVLLKIYKNLNLLVLKVWCRNFKSPCRLILVRKSLETSPDLGDKAEELEISTWVEWEVVLFPITWVSSGCDVDGSMEKAPGYESVWLAFVMICHWRIELARTNWHRAVQMEVRLESWVGELSRYFQSDSIVLLSTYS